MDKECAESCAVGRNEDFAASRSEERTLRVIEVKQSVFASNDRAAEELRARLRERGTFLLNLMSSPGSGKTTTLLRTVEALGGRLSLGVMEADIDSDVDARAMAAAGIVSVQLHTGGMCHLDAAMCAQGLAELDAAAADAALSANVAPASATGPEPAGAVATTYPAAVPAGAVATTYPVAVLAGAGSVPAAPAADAPAAGPDAAHVGTTAAPAAGPDAAHAGTTAAPAGPDVLATSATPAAPAPVPLDLAILENVGNLVCPAEFDTGASVNVAILSVPEGDDKPLKYPLMFEVCDVVLVNKIDVAPYFDFSLERLRANVALRNPAARVIPISAKTGEGIDAWVAYLRESVAAWKAGEFSKAAPANTAAAHYPSA